MDKGLIIHTAIVNEHDQILVIRRQPNDRIFAGLWDLPGGKLEDGEDPAVGAIRETKEETNLDITSPRLFSFTSNVDESKNKQFVKLFFRANFTGGQIVLNPDEHTEYAWVDPKNPADLPYVDYMTQVFQLLVD